MPDSRPAASTNSISVDLLMIPAASLPREEIAARRAWCACRDSRPHYSATRLTRPQSRRISANCAACGQEIGVGNGSGRGEMHGKIKGYGISELSVHYATLAG